MCNCGKGFECSQKANAIHAQEVARKMRLEKPFSKDMEKFFSELYAQNKIIFKHSGHTINATPYIKPFSELLKKHYKLVLESFVGVVYDEATAPKYILPKNNIVNSVSVSMTRVIDTKAIFTAKTIMENISGNISELTKETLAELIAAGEVSSNEVLANLVFDKLIVSAESMSDGIALSEVLNIAEQTKFTEAGEMSKTADKPLTKTWRSILDDRTRSNHAIADGQEQRLTSPFFVGGEYLEYPGDEKGSPANTYNCRCGVTYEN